MNIISKMEIPLTWFFVMLDIKYFSLMRMEFSLVLRQSNIVIQAIIAPKNNQ